MSTSLQINSKMSKILITGSEGVIGKIISEELKKEYNIIPIDKNIGIDILATNMKPYFSDVGTLIHLAANPAPNINKEEAEKNIEISRRVIEACNSSKNLVKIINASSINVYSYFDIYDAGKKITDKTPLIANDVFGDDSYGKAKIAVEKMFEEYCERKNIALLNLRFGCVTKDDKISIQQDGSIFPSEYDIWLRHNDLRKIISKCLISDIQGSYICVSKKDGFIDESIKFPI